MSLDVTHHLRILRMCAYEINIECSRQKDSFDQLVLQKSIDRCLFRLLLLHFFIMKLITFCVFTLFNVLPIICSRYFSSNFALILYADETLGEVMRIIYFKNTFSFLFLAYFVFLPRVDYRFLFPIKMKIHKLQLKMNQF